MTYNKFRIMLLMILLLAFVACKKNELQQLTTTTSSEGIAPMILIQNKLTIPRAFCPYGDYRSTGISSNGLGGSFTSIYTYGTGGADNFLLQLDGSAFLWQTTFTSYYGLSGTTWGTAISVATHTSYDFSLHWWLTPNTCYYHYTWTNL